MAKRIVAFGEIVWDLLPHGQVLGGTPLNLVFRCNSFGEEGHLLSRVGDDELGQAALDKLVSLNISDKNVQLDSEFPTGVVNVTFDENGESRYEVKEDVAFDHIEFSAEALKLARQADCLFFGLLPQRYGLSKNTIRELIKESPDSIHFFDLKLFQHFFNIDVVERLLDCAHIVRIKEKEVEFLAGKLKMEFTDLDAFAEQLSKKYKIELVITTRGNNGISAFHTEKGCFYDPGFVVDMEDNIGSGMAFSAGFLHCYLNGKSLEESIHFGNAAGALNTTKRGATEFFDKNDVLEFMKSTSQQA
ncbi:PfkB family carbohydrate kinase [Maribellus sp. YY47]|uniref:carbohydrate kinase family protein n=1 Tax=Maribellus sp. YY47 TaxID=2929486 RepID=UPI00200102E6|nr:PfkB family carbohydrate kinase [Maribellus sp. YY47]MCK3686268.1 PfkB family carbohydrate kinase [Maribellus sp. YY47]